MSTESIMVRLRRANPVPQAPAGDHSDLLARITASPGDPRLTEASPRRPLLQRRRAIVLVLALGLAALLASTAFAISQWIGGDAVRPPVTRQEYLDAQKQLTLPPGVAWPKFNMPGSNTLTSRGGGGGTAVLIAQNAWECYWVRAIRSGDRAAGERAQAELDKLLAHNILVAPVGAPEGWIPSPMPTVPVAVFAHDGGLNWVRASYKQAAAGDPRNLIASCRANAPT
jgi:hypothetical protein